VRVVVLLSSVVLIDNGEKKNLFEESFAVRRCPASLQARPQTPVFAFYRKRIFTATLDPLQDCRIVISKRKRKVFTFMASLDPLQDCCIENLRKEKVFTFTDILDPLQSLHIQEKGEKLFTDILNPLQSLRIQEEGEKVFMDILDPLQDRHIVISRGKNWFLFLWQPSKITVF